MLNWKSKYLKYKLKLDKFKNIGGNQHENLFPIETQLLGKLIASNIREEIDKIIQLPDLRYLLYNPYIDDIGIEKNIYNHKKILMDTKIIKPINVDDALNFLNNLLPLSNSNKGYITFMNLLCDNINLDNIVNIGRDEENNIFILDPKEEKIYRHNDLRPYLEKKFTTECIFKFYTIKPFNDELTEKISKIDELDMIITRKNDLLFYAKKQVKTEKTPNDQSTISSEEIEKIRNKQKEFRLTNKNEILHKRAQEELLYELQ